jgi:hypothetical protein
MAKKPMKQELEAFARPMEERCAHAAQLLTRLPLKAVNNAIDKDIVPAQE